MQHVFRVDSAKAAAVETIRHAAQLLDLSLTTTAGAPAWGGHALRRGGAEYLASVNIDVWKSKALARHSSDEIARYVGKALHLSLGSLARECAARQATQETDNRGLGNARPGPGARRARRGPGARGLKR